MACLLKNYLLFIENLNIKILLKVGEILSSEFCNIPCRFFSQLKL